MAIGASGRPPSTLQIRNRSLWTPPWFPVRLTVEEGKIVRLHLYDDFHVIAQAVAACTARR